MWIEKTPTGKFKACERYTDLMTGKQKKVSVSIIPTDGWMNFMKTMFLS